MCRCKRARNKSPVRAPFPQSRARRKSIPLECLKHPDSATHICGWGAHSASANVSWLLSSALAPSHPIDVRSFDFLSQLDDSAVFDLQYHYNVLLYLAGARLQCLITSSASNTLIGLLFIVATMPTTRLSIFYLSPLATYSSFAILKSFAASASTFVLCRYESLELQGTMTNFRSLLVSALHPLFTTFFIGRGVMMHFLLALVILFEHKSQLATECKFL